MRAITIDQIIQGSSKKISATLKIFTFSFTFKGPKMPGPFFFFKIFLNFHIFDTWGGGIFSGA